MKVSPQLRRWSVRESRIEAVGLHPRGSMAAPPHSGQHHRRLWRWQGEFLGPGSPRSLQGRSYAVYGSSSPARSSLRPTSPVSETVPMYIKYCRRSTTTTSYFNATFFSKMLHHFRCRVWQSLSKRARPIPCPVVADVDGGRGALEHKQLRSTLGEARHDLRRRGAHMGVAVSV